MESQGRAVEKDVSMVNNVTGVSQLVVTLKRRNLVALIVLQSTTTIVANHTSTTSTLY